MRNLLLTLMVVALMAVPAFAESTTRGNYTTPNENITEWLNSNDAIYHSHDLDKEKKLQKGIGVDVVAYESDGVLEEVLVEGRWNSDTKVTTGYVVAKINLYNLKN